MNDHGTKRGFARLIRRLGLLAHATRAAAAVEFAIVGSIFLLLVCMTLELGLVLFTQSVMDNALRGAARLIRTDQANSSRTFVSAVCNEVGTVLIPSCSTNLQYYVASASGFSSLTAKTSTLPNTYTAGSSASDMLAQIAYKRPALIPWTTQFLGNTDLLIATVAFQNEPY
ncbi:MAG: pilus assembly protein [Alphaproteobacteria bacterium]|nr:pilus assembly protein [Alphaproteobacteria bacterium]